MAHLLCQRSVKLKEKGARRLWATAWDRAPTPLQKARSTIGGRFWQVSGNRTEAPREQRPVPVRPGTAERVPTRQHLAGEHGQCAQIPRWPGVPPVWCPPHSRDFWFAKFGSGSILGKCFRPVCFIPPSNGDRMRSYSPATSFRRTISTGRAQPRPRLILRAAGATGSRSCRGAAASFEGLLAR